MRIDPVLGLRYLNEHPEQLCYVDTETSGLRVDDGRDYAIGASVAYRSVDDGLLYSFYIGWGHVVGKNHPQILLDQLQWVLEEQRRPYGAHNVQFDCNALLSVGIDVWENEFYDTPTMANLINENQPYDKELGTLCQHYLGDAIKLSTWEWEDEFPLKTEKATGWPNTTPAMMDTYARTDAEAGLLLLEHFLEHPLWLELPDEIWEHEQWKTRVLTVMKRRGIRVDQKLTAELLHEGESEKERIKQELGLNPASVKDAYELWINRLNMPVVKRSPKTKRPSFDKGVMEVYDVILENRGDPTAKLVKAYRGWTTAVGLLLRPYLTLLSPDGRLRTTFNTHQTVTGRLSARDPNLQQISKDGGKPWNDRIKKCFIAEPGYVLVNADFSQIELRLATAYSGEWLKEVFADPARDVFDEMTEQMIATFRKLPNGEGAKLADEWTRNKQKTLVYSMQYGAGVKRVQNAFGVSAKVAGQIIQTYRHTFPRFQELASYFDRIAQRDLRVPLWSGRYRKFRWKSEGYKAMNSVMQGGAADIVSRVMVRCFQELDDEDHRLLLTVHDSLVWEVREDLVDDFIPKLKSMMEDVESVVSHVGDVPDVVFKVEVERWE